MAAIDWVFELKEKVPLFLKKLCVSNPPGFYHYSLSGDLYPPTVKWGLGNTVFAVKIYAILGLLAPLPAQEKKALIAFIQSFAHQNGTISDPLVRQKARLRNLLVGILQKNPKNIFGQETIRAETRQALVALKLLEAQPPFPYLAFPQTKSAIRQYLCSLDWQRPWHAGSHLSHLIFFLQESQRKDKRALMRYALQLIKTLQHPQDGAWYCGNPAPQEKINGAMKVLTAFDLAGHPLPTYAQRLIDFSLQHHRCQNACDHLNTLYVLHKAYQRTNFAYRPKAIQALAQSQLENFRQYYFPSLGGFSFRPRQANIYYYNARLTRGLGEPDIHGTLLYLWGITLCAQLLKINDRLGFQALTL